MGEKLVNGPFKNLGNIVAKFSNTLKKMGKTSLFKSVYFLYVILILD